MRRVGRRDQTAAGLKASRLSIEIDHGYEPGFNGEADGSREDPLPGVSPRRDGQSDDGDRGLPSGQAGRAGEQDLRRTTARERRCGFRRLGIDSKLEERRRVVVCRHELDRRFGRDQQRPGWTKGATRQVVALDRQRTGLDHEQARAGGRACEAITGIQGEALEPHGSGIARHAVEGGQRQG
jgi:hypothetical protein